MLPHFSQVASRRGRLPEQLLWIFIYAMVGARMGWILRPFLGHPGSSFTWFRVREANFFADVWRAITELAR
jgi:hypothetical protein